MSSLSYTIGIDFGGVLSEHDGGDAAHKSTVINMKGAIESVSKLKSEMGHKLLIVSFCGAPRARETKASMDASGLSALFDDQFYVSKREHKKYICKHFGCDVMIDDRAGILDDVKAMNPTIVTILFGEDPGSQNKKRHLWAKDWDKVVEIISELAGPKCEPDLSIDIAPYCHRV